MESSGFDELLDRLRSGDEAASAELFELVYSELHRMARAQMRNEASGHTLQPTALVNEAYLRLFQSEPEWESRAHFFGAAAEAMRRVLIDYARRKQAEKRGARPARVTLTDIAVGGEETLEVDIFMLDEALSALEAHDERLSLVVKLRYFVDLSIEETADVLGVSPATVKRDWTYARAWLFERMSS